MAFELTAKARDSGELKTSSPKTRSPAIFLMSEMHICFPDWAQQTKESLLSSLKREVATTISTIIIIIVKDPYKTLMWGQILFGYFSVGNSCNSTATKWGRHAATSYFTDEEPKVERADRTSSSLYTEKHLHLVGYHCHEPKVFMAILTFQGK